jgi:DNA-binding GntR family transcriptional regulator
MTGTAPGMSRTPVKDALNALANESLVDIVPWKGTPVAGLSRIQSPGVRLTAGARTAGGRTAGGRVSDADLGQVRDRLAALDEPIEQDGDVDAHMRRILVHRHRQLAGNRTLLEVKSQRWHPDRPCSRQVDNRRRGDGRNGRATDDPARAQARDAASLAAAVNAHIRRSMSRSSTI